MARILLHSLTFSPDAVSTAYLMTDLARELQRRGHAMTVLTTTPHYNLSRTALERQPLRRRWLGLLYESELDGIRVIHVKIPMKGARVFTRVFDYLYFHFMSLVAGFTAAGRQDAVISPSPPLTIGVIGWLLAVRWGAPCVYNIQELYPDFAINQGLITNGIVVGVLKRLERFVYARSTVVVPISDWFRRIVAARGIPAAKLTVIPNSVDTSLYRPHDRSNPFAVEHQLTDHFVVFYGGNIGLSQDWDSFLFAAEELSDQPILFVIAGGGVREKWLREQCEERRLHNVRFLGYIPRERMPEVNASCDLCTIPMKGATTVDTFPSKIYTIMACGRAVLVQADADSELNWLVSQARCGRVVPPDDRRAYADGILKAYRERSELVEEGRRARAYVVEQYSTEAIGRQYDLLLGRILSNGERS